MEIDRSLTALSNMNVIGEEVVGEKKLVKFATTPKMSTYLVAFAVGEFDYLEVVFLGFTGCIEKNRDVERNFCVIFVFDIFHKKLKKKF
jgi:aminopeptidase N